MSAEQQLSAAGPAPGWAGARLSEEAAGPSGLVFERAGVRVNPSGHRWEEEAFVPCSQGSRLEGLWKKWRGARVSSGTGSGDGRAALDAWQGFAYDVVNQKRRERGMSKSGRGEATGRREYAPLRMILTGKAGTGKSKTVRAIAVGQRRAAEEELEAAAVARRVPAAGAVTSGAQAEGGAEGAEAQRARRERAAVAELRCVLAAPTGCASFQK